VSANPHGLTEREWKIVEAMYRLMPDGPGAVNYEDIVVKAWELYPDTFGLRGYSEKYPDASDLHKPLYNSLKAQGWVQTGPRGQKRFALTASGWERAARSFDGESQPFLPDGRLTRTAQQELQHLERAAATALFHEAREDEILDTDFFAFYRTSVRAPSQEFQGRLAEVGAALREAEEKSEKLALALIEVDSFLRERFADIIDAKTRAQKGGADG
jgi:hypothetical protein